MTTETLTLTMFSPTECVVKKTEKYDADVMEVIRHDKDFPAKYLRFLKAYHDDRKSSSYKEVIYQYAESQKVSQLGRLYVRDMSGLQGFPHDIRNPLTSVHLNAQLLHKALAERGLEKEQRLASVVIAAARRLDSRL